jgi:hypothetical protein
MRTYLIAGNPVTVQKNSFSMTDRLSERTVASFVVLEPDSYITKGMEVTVSEGSTVIFKGMVQKPKAQGDIYKTVSVSCVDFSALVDKRVVAEAYDNTSAGDIVKDLILKYFSEEGITEGTIQDGPTITKAVFNYENGNATMNYICDVSGFYWGVDSDKKLNFFDKSTYMASTSLNDDSQNYKDLKVEENADNYRNRQYTRGGYAISSTQTRTFKGDGETQVFTMDLPIVEEPTVKIDGVTKTVGIRGLETGFDFYWQKDNPTVSQDAGGTKLTSSNTLTVQFKGSYPIIVVAESSSEVDLRKSIEGGSGIYENVVEETTLESKDAALEYTNGLLQKYGFIPKVVTFNTYEEVKAGQIISIINIFHGLSGKFLIENVSAKDDSGMLQYSVKCLDGQNIGGWDRFFKALAQSQKKLAIRENEVLVKLIVLKDSFQNRQIEDAMTYHLHQYKICGQFVCGTEVII